MTDQPTREQRIKEQMQQCSGFEGDQVAKDREAALDYYFQRARGDEVVGRSDVVSGDVSSMVEATVAQMVDAFSSDRICDFDPLGLADEDQAQLESEAVQYLVMGKENGFLQLVMAIKEALLLRNGVMQIDAEEKTERRVKNFLNVQPEAYAELRADDDVVEEDYDQDKARLALTYETTTMSLKVESESLENFIYYADWHKPTLEGIPICGLRRVTSRAELIGLGVDKSKVDELKEYTRGLKTETQKRNPRHNQKSNTALDTSQEMVEWYDLFIRQETDSGADELRRLKFSYQDSVILEDEPAPFINLAAGTAILNPHRFTGISLYDKLKQNQDIRTALRRALLDNVNATTKFRLAGLEDIVNEDDTTDSRVNNMVRVKNVVPDVRAAVMPLAVPDTSANILANLQETGKERSEMGGAALDMQSAQMQIGGDRMGSQGLEKAYSVAEQLTASMMKTIAATLIRSVFMLAHATLREYFDGELPIKKDGKWSYIKPSEWPARHSVTIKPGMSPGERARRVNAMGEVINAQLMLADKGMDEVLVNINSFNAALMEWARLAEVQSPERFFLDPESDASKAALQNKQQQAQRDKEMKATLMQTSLGLEQLRDSLDKYKHDSDLQFQYFAKVLDVEMKEAEIVGDATIDLVKAKQGAQDVAGETETGETATEEPTAEGDTEGPES